MDSTDNNLGKGTPRMFAWIATNESGHTVDSGIKLSPDAISVGHLVFPDLLVKVAAGIFAHGIYHVVAYSMNNLGDLDMFQEINDNCLNLNAEYVWNYTFTEEGVNKYIGEING